MVRAFVRKNGYAAILAAGIAPTAEAVRDARPKKWDAVGYFDREFESWPPDAALTWTLAAQARAASIKWTNYPPHNDLELSAWVLPPGRFGPTHFKGVGSYAGEYNDALMGWFGAELNKPSRDNRFRIWVACEKLYDPQEERDGLSLFETVRKKNKPRFLWKQGPYADLKSKTEPLLHDVIDAFDRNGADEVTYLLRRTGLELWSSSGTREWPQSKYHY